MARGRVFDSDASGSGSRGGRGPGRSARGRGGSIPHPSSVSSKLPRITLSLVAGQHISIFLAKQRGNFEKIIKLTAHKEGYTWDAVPQEARRLLWEEFQDEAITAMLESSLEEDMRRSIRLGELHPYRMRRSGHSETGGDGVGPSRHTGGSISAIETTRLLAKEFGREPTPIEVFTYTHTKDHDLNTFVDRRALSVNGREEVALYLEAVGGSQASQFYCGSAAHASTASAAPQPEHTDGHYTDDIRAQLAD
ncbi:uncharacterized protein LOC110009065 [Jatropha curcas]|uniref:uncharacterized protein LOC110009065 n=1 Tax=Jatropha curcas TaxID=180498 RepID=UPI00189300CA|nr:uncharacterized protein LOC110009065 [Jatropha curcas]